MLKFILWVTYVSAFQVALVFNDITLTGTPWKWIVITGFFTIYPYAYDLTRRDKWYR